MYSNRRRRRAAGRIPALAVQCLEHRRVLSGEALATPQISLFTSSIHAEWTEVESAEYEVWVSLSSADFTWERQTVTTPSYSRSIDDQTFGAFTMWVRAVPTDQSDSMPSPWSQPATLVIETQLTVSTDAVKGDQQPRFTWDPANATDRHEVWINNVTTGESEFIHESFVVHPEYTPPLDLPMGSYDVWVRPISGWVKSSWSEVIRHEVVPTATQPHLATFDPRPALNWNELDGAVAYDLQISSASGVRTFSNLTQTQWSPEIDLDAGTSQWWVRGITADGKSGTWSETAYVYLNQTGNLSATVTHTIDPTQYRWTAVEDAASYQLFVQRLSDGKVIANISGITSNVWSGASLNPGDYRIWVRPTDQDGNQGRWSPGLNVTTEIPTLRIGLEEEGQTSYVDWATRVQPDFSPTGPQGIVRPSDGPPLSSYVVFYNAAEPGERAVTWNPLHAIGLEAGPYEWQAISRGYTELGHFWQQDGFATLTYWSDPVGIFIVGPDSRDSDSEELVFPYRVSRPRFAWPLIDEATSYRLYLEDEQQQQTVLSLPGNIWVPTFDLQDGLWRWWVRPVDEDGLEGTPTATVPFLIATNE